MKSFITAILMFGSLVSISAHSDEAKSEGKQEMKQEMKQELGADKEAVMQACGEEFKATQCSDKELGKGLLKCMHSYRKDHKDFKPSEGCKNALKEMNKDRKHFKKMKAEHKAKKESENKSEEKH